MNDDDHGITQADIIANRETIAANIRRLVAQRSQEHGVTPGDYLAMMLIPQLADNGVGIEELRWVVSLFAPNREPESPDHG